MSSFESKIPKPVNDVTQSPFANKKPEPLLPDWLEEDKHAAEKDIDKDAEGQQVSNDPLVQHKLEMIRCTEENAKTDPLMQHKLDMIRCTEEKEKTDPLVLHKLEMIRCTKEKEKTDPLVLHKLEMIRCTKEKEKTDPVVQMKLAMRNMSTLRVSQPDDSKELEADKKSEEVLGVPLTPEGGIQRLEEDKDTVEDKEELSAKSAGSGGKLSVDAATKDYINNLSGGEPMRKQDQQFFGDRFGADFSDVRIHTDSTAAESAKDINAKAYTKDEHIVFGKGQYQPETDEGKKLLAHELTHVQQQNAAEPSVQRKENDYATLKRLPANFPGKFFDYLYTQYKHRLTPTTDNNTLNKIANETWSKLAQLNNLSTDNFAKHVMARDMDLILSIDGRHAEAKSSLANFTPDQMAFYGTDHLIGGLDYQHEPTISNNDQLIPSGNQLKEQMLTNMSDVIGKNTNWAHRNTSLGRTAIVITIDILRNPGHLQAIGGMQPQAIAFFAKMLNDCQISKIYVTSMWRNDVGSHGIGQAFDITLMILTNGTEVWFRMPTPDKITPKKKYHDDIIDWLKKQPIINKDQIFHPWHDPVGGHWNHLHFSIKGGINDNS